MELLADSVDGHGVTSLSNHSVVLLSETLLLGGNVAEHRPL